MSTFSIIDEGALSHQPGKGCFIPHIAALSHGGFVGANQVGTDIASRDHYLELYRSSDGVHWETLANFPLSEVQERWGYHSLQVYELGHRWMARATRYNHQAYSDYHAEGGSSGPVFLFSEDQGKHWSEPRYVPAPLDPGEYTHHSMGNVIFFDDQHWFFPVQLNNPKGHEGPNHHGAARLITRDGGERWEDFGIVAQDPDGIIEYHDQFGVQLPDGKLYTMLWTIDTGANRDMTNHYVLSEDQGQTWTPPRATNIPGQVCAPILLKDGRIAAIYNDRREPQGIRLAVSDDGEHFDVEHALTVHDAGNEATIGEADDDHFLSLNEKIAFGRPNGTVLGDGTVLVFFWCTIEGVTHTRWTKIAVA